MYYYAAKLARVIDGDTIVLDIDLGFHITVREIVRLLNVDAPETRTLDLIEKEHGKKVKQKVYDLLFAADDIQLECRTQGKYGRWLGIIWANGISVNDSVKKWSEV